jgi:hypothetical protein
MKIKLFTFKNEIIERDQDSISIAHKLNDQITKRTEIYNTLIKKLELEKNFNNLAQNNPSIVHTLEKLGELHETNDKFCDEINTKISKINSEYNKKPKKDFSNLFIEGFKKIFTSTDDITKENNSKQQHSDRMSLIREKLEKDINQSKDYLIQTCQSIKNYFNNTDTINTTTNQLQENNIAKLETLIQETINFINLKQQR